MVSRWEVREKYRYTFYKDLLHDMPDILRNVEDCDFQILIFSSQEFQGFCLLIFEEFSNVEEKAEEDKYFKLFDDSEIKPIVIE